MSADPMSLIQRLRNPAWHRSGMMRGQPGELDVKQTVADMTEAAVEIERLQTAVEGIRVIVHTPSGGQRPTDHFLRDFDRIRSIIKPK